jgi:hypothetical protein
MNTVNRTCVIDKVQEMTFAQIFDELIICVRALSSSFTEWQLTFSQFAPILRHVILRFPLPFGARFHLKSDYIETVSTKVGLAIGNTAFSFIKAPCFHP